MRQRQPRVAQQARLKVFVISIRFRHTVQYYEYEYSYEYKASRSRLIDLLYSTRTRLGGCTGDLRSCANVPSRRDPKLILSVVLPLFGSHLLGNKSKMSGGASLMGAAEQKWQFPPRAYMGVQTSALL